MVFSEGFKSGSTTRFAFFQSRYSVESWLAQKSLSSSSLLNSGIFLLMGDVHLTAIECQGYPPLP
jgi:hypothetical protein